MKKSKFQKATSKLKFKQSKYPEIDGLLKKDDIPAFFMIRLGMFLTYNAEYKFVLNWRDEQKKLFNGEACIYTDKRYCKDISCEAYGTIYLPKLKSHNECIDFVCKIKNFKKGDEFRFIGRRTHSGRYYDSGVFTKDLKTFDPKCEVTATQFKRKGNYCERANEFISALRNNGFLVEVYDAKVYAYGYGKQIKFWSSRRVNGGVSDVLWSNETWARKNDDFYEIDSDMPIDEIIEILKK